MATVLGGLVTYGIVHHEIERQIDRRVEIETEALLDVERQEGLTALVAVVDRRTRRAIPGDTGDLSDIAGADRAMGYMVTDRTGRPIAGGLQALAPPPGGSGFLKFSRADGSTGVAQVMNSPLQSGGRLVVAADRAAVDQVDLALLKVFIADFGLMLLVGGVAVAGFARVVQARLDGVRRSAEAIMAGDMSTRMPLDGSAGEFDQLSVVLNGMLDRISSRLENLRRVSSDVAHDLRTPLTRVRHRLEELQRSAPTEAEQARMQIAITDLDDVLDLFAGLLAISKVEEQTGKERMAPMDLARAAGEILDAYGPAFAAAGIETEIELAPVQVLGDRQLLRQALTNLLDNVLVHAASGGWVQVGLTLKDGQAVLTVTDRGPGVAEDLRDRIFERFVRAESARSSAGHGLGLSMARAVAAAHGGALSLQPTPDGLSVAITIPAHMSR